MNMTAKDLLIHKAQREAIQNRLIELFAQRRAAKTVGETDGCGLRILRPYHLHEWEILDGRIDATFRWTMQGDWDDHETVFTFDEVLLDNMQTIVEAGAQLRGGC